MSDPSDQARARALATRATVAIITALPKELAAMKAMLDGPLEWSVPSKAPGEYVLGEVPARHGTHVVVLVCSSVGENLAAARVTLVLEHFPRVDSVLMVGIGGAVPDPTKAEHDVRLGDIVVSDSKGVIQYDFDKETLRGSVIQKEPRFPPRPPGARLLDAAMALQANELAGLRPWEAFFRRAKKLHWTRRPTDPDVLYSSDGLNLPVDRAEHPDRRKGKPRVFHGPIASGNKLLKNARLRDELRDRHGAKAAEMEAAGVADAAWLHDIGYLVVRGTCDYCDEHKGDPWQGYAAMIAAAYARAVLGRMRSAEPGAQDAEQKRPSPPAGPPPNNLPPRRDFVGRTDELTAIAAAFAKGRHLSVTQSGRASVYGFGGVGKTALALEYAHRNLAMYPGGVWWLGAEGKPVDALVRLAPTLRVHAPKDIRDKLAIELKQSDDIAEAVRVALQNHPDPSLLVLDNVTDPGWRGLIGGGELRVLATTLDEQLALGSPTALAALRTDDALTLCRTLAGEPASEAEARARDRVIVDTLECLAVAVEMAARAVARWTGSWVSYEDLLRRETDRVLEHPQLFGDYPRGVFAALDLSIERCEAGGPERRVLQGAAVFAPNDVPVEWAFRAADIELGSVDAAAGLAGLKSLGLVTLQGGAPMLSMHRLVHRRVRELAPKDARAEELYRGAKYVIDWLHERVNVSTTADIVDARLEHVREVSSAVQEVEWKTEEVFLRGSLALHFWHRGRYDVSRPLSERALEVAETVPWGDRWVLSKALSNHAGLLWQWGFPREALPLLERAVSIDRSFLFLRAREAAVHLSLLALVLKDLGHSADARPLLEQAISIGGEELGPEHPDVAVWISNLATVMDDLGQLEEARLLHERSLTITEKVYGPVHPEVARILSNLAELLISLGRTSEAEGHFRRAIVIDEMVHGPEHPMLSVHLWLFARMLIRLGRRGDGRGLLVRAVTIAQKMLPSHHPHRVAMTQLLASL